MRKKAGDNEKPPRLFTPVTEADCEAIIRGMLAADASMPDRAIIGAIMRDSHGVANPKMVERVLARLRP